MRVSVFFICLKTANLRWSITFALIKLSLAFFN